MKKLIIAAAIVCAAVVSQAASFRWKTTGVQDAAGEASYSGTAMLYVFDNGTDNLVYSGEGTMSAGSINIVITEDAFVGTQKYDAYYTMVDSKGNTFTSTTVTQTASKSNTAVLNFGNGGSWSAVPEPTSGLLLLLGVAGLALKRKRA